MIVRELICYVPEAHADVERAIGLQPHTFDNAASDQRTEAWRCACGAVRREKPGTVTLATVRA